MFCALCSTTALWVCSNSILPSPSPSVVSDADSTITYPGSDNVDDIDVILKEDVYKGFISGSSGCVVRKKGKVHSAVVAWKGADSELLNESVYLADDGCAMGHLVKDAAGAASLLLSGVSLKRIVFAHPCASAKESPSLFNTVILLWFKIAQDIAKNRGIELMLSYVNSLPQKSCYSRVYTRLGWRWFLERSHAEEFRAALYNRMPPSISAKGMKVMVLQRKRNRRVLAEKEAIRYIQERLGVAEVAVVSFEDSARYVEQLALLRAVDVFVAVHGAALASIVAMRAGSGVVELFPHNFRYLMFEELARLCSLVYSGVEAKIVSPGCKKTCPIRVHNISGGGAHEVHIRHMMGKKICKNCDVALPPEELYHAVKDVLLSVMLLRARRTNVLEVDRRA